MATTDPNRAFTYSLMQAGLPYRLGFMLITALRFIPVFHYELEQVKNAQMAKGIEIEGPVSGPTRKSSQIPFGAFSNYCLETRWIIWLFPWKAAGSELYPRRSYLYVQSLSRGDKIAMGMIPLVFILFNLTIASRFAW